MTKAKKEPEAGGEDRTLEGRLRRLEAILGRLESDEASLEDALQLFQEGVGHVREAEALLARTERTVEELLANGVVEPFAGDED